MSKIEVHRQARDMRVKLIVEMNFQILANVEICNLKLAEIYREDIPLMLEQLFLLIMSMILMLKISRFEY